MDVGNFFVTNKLSEPERQKIVVMKQALYINERREITYGCLRNEFYPFYRIDVDNHWSKGDLWEKFHGLLLVFCFFFSRQRKDTHGYALSLEFQKFVDDKCFGYAGKFA